MANVYATKTGLWSDTTVWNTGALPTSVDNVYTNTFTVTANTNTMVSTIRNGSTTGISAGGTVILANGVSLSATLASTNTQTTQVLMTLAPAATATITGSPALFNNIPGSATLAPLLSCPIGTATTINTTPTSYLFTNIAQTVIYNNSSNLVINGNIGFTLGNTASRFVDQASTSSAKTTFNGNLSSSGGTFVYNNVGTVTVNGNINMQTGGIGFNPMNGSVISVVGNVGNQSGSSTVGSAVVFGNGFGQTSTLSITGNVYDNAIWNQNGAYNMRIKGDVISILGAPIYNASGAGSYPYTATIEGNVVASAGGSAHYGTGTVYLSGSNITNGPNGRQAIYAPKVLVSPGSSATYTRHAVNGYNSYVDYWTSNATFTYPASSNVASGTTYSNNTLSGSMVVPSASSVAFGAPVGISTGTASITIDSILSQPISGLTTSNSIGARLKNITTSQALSSVVNSLNFTN